MRCWIGVAAVDLESLPRAGGPGTVWKEQTFTVSGRGRLRVRADLLQCNQAACEAIGIGVSPAERTSGSRDLAGNVASAGDQEREPKQCRLSMKRVEMPGTHARAKFANEDCEGAPREVQIAFSILPHGGDANAIWWEDNFVVAPVPVAGKESEWIRCPVRITGSGPFRIRARIIRCDDGDCQSQGVDLAPGFLDSDLLSTE